MSPGLALSLLPGVFAIGKLDPGSDLPADFMDQAFVSVVRTAEELSIVCLEERMPPAAACSPGWRALQVRGPLDLSLTGVMASLASPLALAGVSLFAVSSYNTDTLLLRAETLERAIRALQACGHDVEWEGGTDEPGAGLAGASQQEASA
jgi:hypothetical protein